MTSRSKRASIAKETLAILKSGRYELPTGVTVSIKRDVAAAVKGTIHYRSDGFDEVEIAREEIMKAMEPRETQFMLENCSTLKAAAQLSLDTDNGHIACLNFASAKHPGGGFLNGSQAQEESLARASGLHPCIFPKRAHYEEGRNCGTCLYTDSILFSPRVPVFRDDKDNLLETPYTASMITSAAVNTGALELHDPLSVGLVGPTMLIRTERVLSVAVVNRVDTLVLGAWGCGVFKNDPSHVADWFHHFLVEDPVFSRAFKTVFFAVLDRSPDQLTFAEFEKRFGSFG